MLFDKIYEKIQNFITFEKEWAEGPIYFNLDKISFEGDYAKSVDTRYHQVIFFKSQEGVSLVYERNSIGKEQEVFCYLQGNSKFEELNHSSPTGKIGEDFLLKVFSKLLDE